jgi:hypothetical protein
VKWPYLKSVVDVYSGLKSEIKIVFRTLIKKGQSSQYRDVSPQAVLNTVVQYIASSLKKLKKTKFAEYLAPTRFYVQ